jgi:predicted NBD/HSP70 family sugar kinase
LANKHFAESVKAFGKPLVIGLEREDGKLSRFETLVFPEDHPQGDQNFYYTERLVKFLLWQRGGYRIFIGGPVSISEHIKQAYSALGAQKFDFHFMGDQVYEKSFEVILCKPHEVPAESGSGHKLGGNLDGNRIGFDLGASDRKVSAVVDGEVIFSEEKIWEPTAQTDIQYHYTEIMDSLQTAASKMTHVDAIGGSSAGIYINNQPMVASLFRGIPEHQRSDVKHLFTRIQKKFGVPLVVINDGDVTALAGAKALGDTGILGIALGSSEAGGYVDMEGHILGWLNELSFAPIDYSPESAIDEWSGDRGCGSSYLSQQCVFRLAPLADIEISDQLTNAEKLLVVQEKLRQGHEGAVNIWKTMGVYLGYAIAHYADFYKVKHVIILGRCTSWGGGSILVEQARHVMAQEFPSLAEKIEIRLPDEKQRRVGQAIAAASLPMITSR